LQVGAGATVASTLFGFAQCLADQVLGQDGILAVQLIPRLGGLKIEADSAIFSVAVKLSQFPDVFTSDHFTPFSMPQK
jgi:hypothetical protein